MVTISASIVLGANGLTTTDISAVNTEVIIDQAIDYVNLIAGTSIAALTGAGGSMTGTLTRDQNAAVSLLLTLYLREVKKTSLTNSGTTGSTSTSQSIGVGGLNVSQSSAVSSAVSMASVINNPANSPEQDLFWRAIRRLSGYRFQRA